MITIVRYQKSNLYATIFLELGTQITARESTMCSENILTNEYLIEADGILILIDCNKAD